MVKIKNTTFYHRRKKPERHKQSDTDQKVEEDENAKHNRNYLLPKAKQIILNVYRFLK